MEHKKGNISKVQRRKVFFVCIGMLVLVLWCSDLSQQTYHAGVVGSNPNISETVSEEENGKPVHKKPLCMHKCIPKVKKDFL